jgi:ABC-type sugar transport system ATPase subunit
MATLRLEGVAKSFGSTRVLERVDLDVADGEFIVLVGPSGCGKSTLLRCIAGLELPTEGTLSIGGREVTHAHPRDRDVAMVFQSYALYPHMTVRRNMGFALEIAGRPRAEIEAAVTDAARMLELEHLLERKPAQLSGGQRQRVAIGRAIVRKPSVFLFDEPLSNLDAALRLTMRVELKRLHKRMGTTMVYVTHDQVEAMTLADRLVVLERGVAQQIGSPMQVHDEPANRFVAGFIGSPAMNFLDRIEEDAVVGVRPQHVLLGDGAHLGRVDVIEPLGTESLVHLDLGGEHLVARTEKPPLPGEIRVGFARTYRFDRRSGERLA